MHVLWIIDSKTCTMYEISKLKHFSWGTCCLKSNKISLNYKNINRIIAENKGIHIQNVYFFHESGQRVWTWLKIDEPFIFGRNVLKKENYLISEYQFKIQNGILLHTGKNGTFLNGKKVNRANLLAGDSICVPGCSMYYFKDYMLCNQILKNPTSIDYKIPKLEKKFQNRKQRNTEKIELKKIELEPFKNINEISPTPLFQTISSSSLILISTLVGIGIQIKMQPERLTEILWMSITSFTMGISCIILGCLNRKIQIHQNKRKVQCSRQEYKTYVINTKKQFENEWMKWKKLKNDQRILWETLDTSIYQMYESEFMIPIQRDQIHFSFLEYPHLNYEQKNDELYSFLLHEIHPYEIEQWKYLRNGNKTWIQTNQVKDLFIRWAWSVQGWKWIWVGEIDEKITYYPICRQERTRLWIHEESDIQRISRFIDSKEKYVVCITEAKFLETLQLKENMTLLYCSLENVHYKFDEIISKPWIFHYSWNQLRRPIYFENEKNKSWNDTFKIDCLEDLSILDLRLHQKNMEIPIGFHGNTVISINLMDAHGLIAGTTGSGKSEFLTSLLFQLCVRYSSKKLQYILIDFKGGAFSYAFQSFPHCAGIVTNLDAGEIQRFQISLKSEVENRQKKMMQFLQKHPNETAHIESYNRFESCMSHLFIIVDEFAQLKSAFPEVLQFLKEIARIGRSLGIHLILSTQKPSGIVDEQIWANSKFKVCFKVQTPMDSKEILMHDHAFHLTQAGQFYMQESGKSEQFGRSLYSQELADLENQHYWTITDSQDVPIFCSRENNKKVSEILTNKIKSISEEKNWILYPSLKDIFPDTLASIDDPENQTVQSLSLEYGQSCAILFTSSKDEKAWLDMIQTLYEDLYIFGDNVKKESLWYLFSQKKQFTFVLKDNINFLKIFFDQKDKSSIRFFYIFRNFEGQWNSYLKNFTYCIASGDKDKESLRTFYNQYSLEYKKYPYAWILQSENLKTMKWYAKGYKKNKLLEEPPLITQSWHEVTLPDFLLGYTTKTYQPIYWNHNHKLIMVYEKVENKSFVEKILKIWKNNHPDLKITENFQNDDFDIAFGSIVKNQNWILSYQNLFKIDIAWFGQNVNDYVHLLQKKMVFETYDFILWQQEKIKIGERISLYE